MAGPIRPAHDALDRHAARRSSSTARAPASGTTTGNEYLDFLAGIAVNSLGHAHPVFVEAVAPQAATLAHVSNYFTTEPALELAERLTRLAGAGEHGARLVRQLRRRGERGRVQARAPQQLRRRAHPRARARRRASTAARWARSRSPASRTCASRSSRCPAASSTSRRPSRRSRRRSTTPSRRSSSSRSRARPASSSCPTGSSRPHASSRTGTARCSSSTRSRPAPDAPASGSPSSTPASRPTRSRSRRASAAAFPIGGLVTFGAASSLYSKGQHGSTFGGNPLATAVANAVLGEIERAGLVDERRAPRPADRASASRRSARRSSPAIRGRGLLIGVGAHRARRRRGRRRGACAPA